VLYLMYEEGFRWWNLGRASAVAFLLFVLMVAATRGLMHFARRTESTP
jgi:multiple sugar transport system permease protein